MNSAAKALCVPPKRKPYEPRQITCEQCGGRGWFMHRSYPSARAAASKVDCAGCNGKGKVVPTPVLHARDCTGCGGIYRCIGCRGWFGWCYGAADDMPDHCDGCWAKAHPAPKRQRTAQAPPATKGTAR